MDAAPSRFSALAIAWLALVALTLVSLGLGEWFGSADWLPLLVAAIVWLKGVVVARRFIESHLAHPFIERVVQAFIALAPVALVVTSYFGHGLARLTTL